MLDPCRLDLFRFGFGDGFFEGRGSVLAIAFVKLGCLEAIRLTFIGVGGAIGSSTSAVGSTANQARCKASASRIAAISS
ncbi:MAG: hypothetical protein ACXW0L_09345, partial [Methylosarcina sp.]